MRLMGPEARMGEMINAYKILVGNLNRRETGTPRHKWEDNNK
jgi:hypothetical protein